MRPFSPLFLVFLLAGFQLTTASEPLPGSVRIPRSASGEVDVADVVARLARATEVTVPRPSAALSLPLDGLAGTLSMKMLAESLGPDAAVAIEPRALVVSLPPRLDDPARRDAWKVRLQKLALHVETASQQKSRYGMHALKSYRPNDPDRPTICLVHGVNSSGAGFVHMVPWLEEAGFGIVVYDYPFNRSIEESGTAFARDWKAFHKDSGDTRPWNIVAHSMGALVARLYVEDPQQFGHDVAQFIMIAPVNQGSNLARAQTILQLLNGMQAVNGKKAAEGLAQLSDGVGVAAEDMTPGSALLKALNRRPRAQGVSYHILAGDIGVLTPALRQQIEDQANLLRSNRGLLGGLARAATSDLSTRLDELTTGTGDGCVSVANTKLEGVTDHVTIHANHAELIRAPLLFADPGPVACMPYLLRWLGKNGSANPEPVKSR